MALYDYELAIVCQGNSSEPLSRTLGDDGLLVLSGRPGEATLFGMSMFVDDFERDIDGAPLRATRLLFDAEPFEAFIRSRFADLVAWLWNVAEAINPLTMFIPSGSDARSSSRPDALFADLPQLLASGAAAVAHPVVYFAEALADGALCRPVENIAYYEVQRAPGLGCLYLFVSRNEAGVDILETGSLQREMLAQLRSRRR